MAGEADDILGRELAKLAEQTAKRAGVKDVGGLRGRLAHSAISWVVEKMPDDAWELASELPVAPELALRRAAQVLSAAGRLEPGAESPRPSLCALVPSGFLGLNPAVVTVAVEPAAEGARVVVRGVAKEGLIKQRAGEKAARRIADRLVAALAG